MAREGPYSYFRPETKDFPGTISRLSKPLLSYLIIYDECNFTSWSNTQKKKKWIQDCLISNAKKKMIGYTSDSVN